MKKEFSLYDKKISKDFDIIEIGGGLGEISSELIRRKYNLKLFLEPDSNKFSEASINLPVHVCQNINLSHCDFSKINPSSQKAYVIMQDVIEHIPKLEQLNFFKNLTNQYQEIFFIGRTPNLKSPFGARNSFGDMTHLYRFTDTSLKSFLNEIGFQEIKIYHEPYRITGLTSLMRYPLYLFTVGICSLAFVSIFGRWEGIQTPNIIFNCSNFKK